MISVKDLELIDRLLVDTDGAAAGLKDRLRVGNTPSLPQRQRIPFHQPK